MAGWSIFPDFLDILLANDPEPVRKLMHGMYAYDAPDPVGYVKKVRDFTLKGIGDKITQDMLIIGGRDDHSNQDDAGNNLKTPLPKAPSAFS